MPIFEDKITAINKDGLHNFPDWLNDFGCIGRSCVF
jgi:hypothetical protein